MFQVLQVSLCHKYSVLLLSMRVHQKTPRRHVNERMWLLSDKTLFAETSSGPDLATGFSLPAPVLDIKTFRMPFSKTS